MLDRQLSGLKKSRLLANLSDEQVSIVSDRCRWQQCDKGQQIISQEDPSTEVFFVVEGEVRAKSYSLSGREVSFNDIADGDIFGEFSAIDGQDRASSVFALRKCLLARMSASDFRRTLMEMPEASIKLIEILVEKTRILSDRVFEFSTLPVQGRVIVELLRLADKGQESESEGTVVINPAPTHYEMATRISTHREAVTRELNHLVDEEIITVQRRRIDVLDIDRLRELADDALHG